MGKRAAGAAAKPKAAPAAKSAAKRIKLNAVRPPAAPTAWGRPPASTAVSPEAPLCFFLVDIEDGSLFSDGLELRLYGVTAEGVSVCARLRHLRPYFYARVPDARALAERMETVRDALEQALPSNLRRELSSTAVLSVELVSRTPAYIYQPEEEMLRIVVAGPRLMAPCVKVLEQGIRVPPTAGSGGDTVELQSSSTFEANIPQVLRFLVDFDLGGGRWVELAPGAFEVLTKDTNSTAQLEVSVDLANAAVSGGGLRAVALESELGSSIPPLRTAALEVLTDAEGYLTAAACVVAVQGQDRPQARGIWLRRAPSGGSEAAAAAGTGGEWSAVTMEVYDPSAVEAPKVFACEDEELLAQHLGDTLALLDADILLSYDLPAMLRGVLGQRGLARPGSSLVRGFCRRLAAELKLTAKSNEVSGLAGRLGFDLQRQVEKDHRLTDYCLGNLSEHFCKEPFPELREATLARLLAERPRAFAQHVLRKAEASLHIFHRLAYLYNFVEMARVTGCPLAYLLERGQAVKVQAQLLHEAQLRGFVLPSQRPGTGEELSYEGATVLEPSTGFYRCPVAVLDFASLYPSIMMAHNICYTTLLPAGRERDPAAPKHTVAPPSASAGAADSATPKESGCFVDKSIRQGLLPSILERLLSARKATKKQLNACAANEETRRKVLNGRQLALKLSANSVYGFTGALNGPLPCLEVASAVTAFGREMIQATKKHVEAHFVKANGFAHDAVVLYGDTDSVMVRFGDDDLPLEEAMRLSAEAAKVCSAAFPAPVRLEFEKVYKPFLLMAKKRYAGLAWTVAEGLAADLESKGLETVRRDWSDLVRQGLDRTLRILLRADGADGSAEAAAYVQGLCQDLRQNKVDFRSLVISKSLGREEYATKTPHMEVAEKLRKRDAANAPGLGDRVSYLVLAGPVRAKVFEKAEDPLYALEHELPIDAEYYLENQLKSPLLRVFELVYGSTQKAEQVLFTPAAGQKVAAAAPPSSGGLGKFVKARPKCVDCNTALVKSPEEAFCAACEAKGPQRAAEVKAQCVENARRLRAELQQLRAHCERWCATPAGDFPDLPPDAVAQDTASPPAKATAAAPTRESCANSNCQVIFRRARLAKELEKATDTLKRLKVEC